MTNSPPTFQNMMNDILKDVIDKGIVIVFIDDILIFMENEEHHDEIVEEVLRRLKENDLFLKPEKCEFKKEIEFLGMIIGEEGVKMDLTKVDTIMSWLMPKHFWVLPISIANLFKTFQKSLHPYIILCAKRLYGDRGEVNRRHLMD